MMKMIAKRYRVLFFKICNMSVVAVLITVSASKIKCRFSYIEGVFSRTSLLGYIYSAKMSPTLV